MHRGCFVWTPTPPLSGRRTPRPGVCVCVCVLFLAGSGGPTSRAPSGPPHLFLWPPCPSSLLGPLGAGVARALGACFFFPFFSLCVSPFFPPSLSRPRCLRLSVLPGPRCPGPWRFAVAPNPPLCVFVSCVFSLLAPPFFFLLRFCSVHPTPFCCILFFPFFLPCSPVWLCPPPPSIRPPFIFLFLVFSLSLCPLSAPLLSRLFRCFRPWVPWALALCLRPRLLPPLPLRFLLSFFLSCFFFLFFFVSPLIFIPFRFSLVPGALRALGLWSAWPGSSVPLRVRPWVWCVRCMPGLLSASCLAGAALLPRLRWLVLCVVACGCGVFAARSGCPLLFSAGVLWRGWSCLAAWPAACLCSGLLWLPCAVSFILWLCGAVWPRAVVPCCPFCFAPWSMWRFAAPWRRLRCVVVFFG